MSLIRYSQGYAPLTYGALQQQINRIFDDLDGELTERFEEIGSGAFVPPMDLREDADAYTLHLEVPGVAREDLDISLQDNTLIVRGARRLLSEAGEGELRRTERQYGAFARSVHLPRAVDSGAVEARLENGVLEITLPKSEAAKPRQISISAGAASGRQFEAESTANTSTREPSKANSAAPSKSTRAKDKADKGDTQAD